jgi:SAM-dependent methyltransferase
MICCRYYTAAQLVSGKQVLEIGCGMGRGLGYLSARAQRVVGGDYTKENLGYARQHYGDRVALILLDAQELPFKDNSFDVVVVMEVIQYLLCLDEFFEECYRVLSKGGVLCLCLPNKDVLGFQASPLSHGYYSAPELSALLNRYRFDVEVFGAFPILRGSIWERFRTSAIMTVSRCLDIIPRGSVVKGFLNRIILGETVVTKRELDDDDMIPENLKLTPIPDSRADFQHKILYAIAHSR